MAMTTPRDTEPSVEEVARERICDTCAFYQPVHEIQMRDTGECRRRASNWPSGWPSTSRLSWCGEYVSRLASSREVAGGEG